jgi:hypothetical protein
VSVPIEQWGRDHKSMLLYIEHCCVDCGGNPALERMRCDPDLHPGLAHRASRASRGVKYPTRLAGGAKLENHDDWSCIEDMEELGLVVNTGTGIHPKWKLTDNGWALAWEYRRQLAERNGN